MAFFVDAVSNFIVRYQGEFQVGARARFFDAGTNTPRVMYSDGLLTSPFDPDDITTDANAQFPSIWGQGGPFKVIITTASGNVVRSIDNVPGDVEASGGGGGGGGGTDLEPGDILVSFLSGVKSGFVRANGRTIGSASSAATELASADAEALFLAYWPNTLLSVSGGRGASAAADWAANKTITLPNAQLRGLVGVDAMGAAASNLFSALTFTSGTSSTVGSTVGAATHALTVAQTAAHSHTGSTDTTGSHSHTGVTDSQGDHAHSGATDLGGLHAHNVGVNASAGVLLVGAGGGNATQSGLTNYTTAVDGIHNHSFTTGIAGAHGHNYTTNANGAHSHAVTVGNTGNGDAHPNVQPSILVTVYIKL